MDYEQKYKDAMARLELVIRTGLKLDPAYIFPELAESEDERIREATIKLLNRTIALPAITEIDGIRVEQMIAWLEKQKDADKAILAVNKIDKYIDLLTANAHDMKDSNPDKRYYCGWDDALGKIAGILQDVYSEKQKESLHIPESCKENADSFTDDDERIRKELLKFLQSIIFILDENGTVEKVFYADTDIQKIKKWIAWLEKQKEQKPNPLYGSTEEYYREAYYDQPEKEQKSEYSAYFDLPSNEFEACMLRYLQSAANRKDDLEIAKDTKEYAAQLMEIAQKEQKPISDSVKFEVGFKTGREFERRKLKPAEWSEEDEKILNGTLDILRKYGYHSHASFLNSKLKSLRPSWKPSKEQMGCLERLIVFKNRELEDIKGCKSLYNDLKKLI